MAGNAVLIVEDEREIREMIAFALERAGFRVMEASSAEAAIEQLEGLLPDVVVVDWMLPGSTGIELVRRIRRDAHTAQLPLLMLTARGEETDKLRSFEVGVDDYVTKPFSPRELIARIKALLRRTGAPEDGILRVGDVQLDTLSHRLSISGTSVHIGPTEFRLLEFLMRSTGRLCGRMTILEHVWDYDFDPGTNLVDVYVRRLRDKVDAGFEPKLIHTVRGVGYVLEART